MNPTNPTASARRRFSFLEADFPRELTASLAATSDLPDEVLALVNNWTIHKTSDANVIARLRKSIDGISDGIKISKPVLAGAA